MKKIAIVQQKGTEDVQYDMKMSLGWAGSLAYNLALDIRAGNREPLCFSLQT